jgi:hypothetical protein
MPENSKLMLKNVRLSYCNLFEPRAIAEGGALKYSVSIIIPKSEKEQLSEIKKILSQILEEQKWTPAQKKAADLPIRDGDAEREEEDAYKNSYFMNPKSNRKPLVVDQRRQVVESDDIVYSGCYANVYVSFYPYDKAGNKGVGVGLLGVQKVKDGEPLGNTITADIFSDIEDESGDKSPFDFID